MNQEKGTIKSRYWIRELIEMTRNNEFVLPEIQREFVWDLRRIADLWDSIYRGYPIGQLLFWDAETSVPLYGFEDSENEFLFINNKPSWHHTNVLSKEETSGKIIVLDGQQRLTSLFLGAREEGVVTMSRNKKKQKRLCLYVGSEDVDNEDNEIELFDWKVLGEEGDDYLPVATILYNKDTLKERTIKGKRYVRNFLKAIDKNRDNKVLVDKICFEDSVRVVDVFHRLNSGGKNMDMSELFLSLLFGNSEKNGKKDVRDKLDAMRAEFSKGYFEVKDSTITQLLRFVFVDESTGLSQVRYGERTYDEISDGLNDILKAIEETVEFLNEDCGIYTNEEMTSHTLFLPLVYVFYKKRKMGVSEELKAELKCFAYRALMFNLFSKSTTTILARLKKAINEMEDDGFIVALNVREKEVCFPDLLVEDGRISIKAENLKGKINKIVENEEKGEKTNQILLLMSSEPKNIKGDGCEAFDQDHIFARELFSAMANYRDLRSKRFGVVAEDIEERERLVSDEEIDKWKSISDKYVSERNGLGYAVKGKFNTLPNLWLLEQSLNKSNNKKNLRVWLEEMQRKKGQGFIDYSYTETMVTNRDFEYLRLSNFGNFYENRLSAIEEKLYKMMALPKHIR